MFYHLSRKNGLTVLTPRVPENIIDGYEDDRVKRVCFSTSITGALRGIESDGEDYYVYSPSKEVNFWHKPSIDEVVDVKYTHEVWCLNQIQVKLLGKIKTWVVSKNNVFFTSDFSGIIETSKWKWIWKADKDGNFSEDDYLLNCR